MCSANFLASLGRLRRSALLADRKTLVGALQVVPLAVVQHLHASLLAVGHVRLSLRPVFVAERSPIEPTVVTSGERALVIADVDLTGGRDSATRATGSVAFLQRQFCKRSNKKADITWCCISRGKLMFLLQVLPSVTRYKRKA